MEDRLITTKEVGNYRIKIYYDTDSVCPCESWDMAACFLWEYSDSSPTAICVRLERSIW